MKLGFCSLLTLLFIGLKLTSVITWSWVWVLSPMWIGGLLSLLIVFLVAYFSTDNNFYK